MRLSGQDHQASDPATITPPRTGGGAPSAPMGDEGIRREDHQEADAKTIRLGPSAPVVDEGIAVSADSFPGGACVCVSVCVCVLQ